MTASRAAKAVTLAILLLPACEKSPPSAGVSTALLEFRLTSVERTEGYSTAIPGLGAGQIFVADTPLLTDADVSAAEATRTENGDAAVLLKLTEHGKSIMRESADKYVNRQLAVYLDHQLIETPTVHRPLGGLVMITRPAVGLQPEEIERIVNTINARSGD
jgi:preprotein translocase subunit SecD